MSFPRRKFLHLAAGAAALPVIPVIPPAACAKSYPSRPVRLIVDSPPADPVALTGQFLLKGRGGLPVMIERRIGANGNLAAQELMTAPADGYTVLLAASTNIFNVTLYPDPKFDFVRDVAPVASIANQPFVVVVPLSFPARTLPEFIAYAKKTKPGKINMGSGGSGTASHIFGELFNMMAGVDLAHVPYRISYMPDLLAGQLQVAFTPLLQSSEYIRNRKLRALAVTTAKRIGELPDLPTVGEFVPGYVAANWFGIVAPKNTPADIVNQLNKAINSGLANSRTKVRLAHSYIQPMSMTPEEFGKFMADENEKWSRVIRSAGIKA